MANEPKVLLFDIETAPLVTYTWGTFQQDAIDVVEDWYMLCFAYKWLGEKQTKVKALPDYKGYNPGSRDDKALAQDLAALFHKADIIIAHNGDKFDIKKANARFVEHGLPSPSHYRTIDTLKVCRKHFKLTSNRLDKVGKLLGVGRKLPHSGFDLWKGCMEGDKKSWKTMKAYNKQDVTLLEEVYLKLRPWIDNHPNLVTIAQLQGLSCTNCLSTNLKAHGFRYAQGSRYRRLQCMDCGAWVKQSIPKTGDGKISNK